MTVQEILVAARELLSDPKRWTRVTYARRADGSGCNPQDPEAVCWCLAGAIDRVHDPVGDNWPLNIKARALVSHAVDGVSVASLNDDLGYDAVMAGLNKAIES